MPASDFAEVYGASISKDTISKITDKVIEDMTTGATGRPIISPHLHRRV